MYLFQEICTAPKIVSIVVLCIELLELLELSGFNDAIVPQVEKLDSIHLSQGSALFKLEEVGELRIVCAWFTESRYT